MSILLIETLIRAPLELCFDLARNVEVHCKTVGHTRERAVGGVTTGLLEMGDSVTWEAVHFGLKQRLTVKITEYERPHRFVDEQTSGSFQRLKHLHEFKPTPEGTLMTDRFEFEAPFGILGQTVDALFLQRYLRRLLTHRITELKAIAEREE